MVEKHDRLKRNTMRRNIYCLISLAMAMFAIGASAQLQVRMDKDSPMRKLQLAEMLVTNFYVDSVDVPRYYFIVTYSHFR